MRQKLQTSGGIRLKDVFPEAHFFGDQADLRISSCCSDSRQCQPGDLFAALVGRDHDGHDFASSAVQRGASAVLAERILPIGVPTCLVDDTRDAFGRLCHALAGHPSDQLCTVGVTGTLGKTTTSILIAAVIEAAGASTGMIGSLGWTDGVDVTSTTQGLPPSASQLAHRLAKMVSNGCSHAVLEASSRELASRQLTGASLDAAVLTNVRRANLDLHGNVLNYRRAKQQLFSLLKPNGFAVINADDPASKFVLNEIKHPVLTVAMHAPAEVTGELLERHSSEQTFLLCAGNDAMPVRTATIGNSHIYHCLQAAAVGLVLGIDLPTIARGLESVDYVPGRLERIECGQDCAVFVDQANHPDGLAVTLKALRQVTTGRLICVYGAPGEANDAKKSERPLLGRVVERYADIGIITNNNPRGEEPLQIAHDILDGYDRPAQAQLMPDRVRAIGWALAEAGQGDTVLIAGRGNEAIHVVGNRHEEFDDREVVRCMLHELEQAVARRRGRVA